MKLKKDKKKAFNALYCISRLTRQDKRTVIFLFQADFKFTPIMIQNYVFN